MDDLVSVTIIPTITVTWVVRHGHEWGVFCLNEKLGLVSAQTSYGNYAHIWTHIGELTLEDFIAKIDFDYAMGKFIGTKTRFRPGATVKAMKEDILYSRRSEGLDGERAREFYALLGELTDVDDATAFGLEIQGSDYAEWNQEWTEFMRYGFLLDAQSFWDCLWVPFINYIKG